jgi:hypothetical protein
VKHDQRIAISLRSRDGGSLPASRQHVEATDQESRECDVSPRNSSRNG